MEADGPKMVLPRQARPDPDVRVLASRMVLPRQARDKHRESTQKRDVFSIGSCSTLGAKLRQWEDSWVEQRMYPEYAVGALGAPHASPSAKALGARIRQTMAEQWPVSKPKLEGAKRKPFCVVPVFGWKTALCQEARDNYKYEARKCIIIDHFSAFEPGLVAPFLTLRDKKRLGSSQNGPKFEPRRVSKPFL
jgi:hypothetical protein